MDPFKLLENRTITDIQSDMEGNNSLIFDGAILAIFNPVTYSTLELEQKIIGRRISSIISTESEFVMLLDDGTTITVKIDDDSFQGPEAMSLQIGRDFFAVWP